MFLYSKMVFDRHNGCLNETIIYSDDVIRPVLLIIFGFIVYLVLRRTIYRPILFTCVIEFKHVESQKFSISHRHHDPAIKPNKDGPIKLEIYLHLR